jgi:two-component system nitrogen regulation sensor histidine kinase NtrY
VGAERAALEQYADVIIRQTNDLRGSWTSSPSSRGCPAPERKRVDLGKLLGETVLLQESARPDIRFTLEQPPHAVLAFLDPTMINQALTNLLKNAQEAIDAREPGAEPGAILVRLTVEAESLTMDILDNGAGLPDQPARLFEPYVTHRPKGTGLGLSIVKKIVEEHDGTLELRPAAAFDGGTRAGAWARITLPQAVSGRAWDADEKTTISKKMRESM